MWAEALSPLPTSQASRQRPHVASPIHRPALITCTHASGRQQQKTRMSAQQVADKLSEPACLKSLTALVVEPLPQGKRQAVYLCAG